MWKAKVEVLQASRHRTVRNDRGLHGGGGAQLLRRTVLWNTATHPVVSSSASLQSTIMMKGSIWEGRRLFWQQKSGLTCNSMCHLRTFLRASHRSALLDLHHSQGSWDCLSGFGITLSSHPLLFYRNSSFPAVCLCVVSLYSSLKVKMHFKSSALLMSRIQREPQWEEQWQSADQGQAWASTLPTALAQTDASASYPFT